MIDMRGHAPRRQRGPSFHLPPERFLVTAIASAPRITLTGGPIILMAWHSVVIVRFNRTSTLGNHRQGTEVA
jgi:hypothetical protein